MSPPQAPQPIDQNKAIASGVATLLGGAVATIIIHIVNKAAPGWLDADTTGAVQTIVVAAIAYASAYLVPHKS